MGGGMLPSLTFPISFHRPKYLIFSGASAAIFRLICDATARPYYNAMIKLAKSSPPRAGPLCVILSPPSASFPHPAATDVVVTGNTRFAFDLYARLKSTDGNLFFSPYSISTCLAMTWAGARGNTESQMAGVFHFSTVQTGLHSQFASLQKQLNAIQEKKEVALNIANGLWAQKEHPFLPAFLQIATRDYAAKVQQVDFLTGAESARNDINDWVSGKTADRIQH